MTRSRSAPAARPASPRRSRRARSATRPARSARSRCRSRATTQNSRSKGLTFTMPPGASAKLAGVPLCSDANAAAGTCPEASRIGSVTAGSGRGIGPVLPERLGLPHRPVQRRAVRRGRRRSGERGTVPSRQRGRARVDPHRPAHRPGDGGRPTRSRSSWAPRAYRPTCGAWTLRSTGRASRSTRPARSELHTTGTLTSVGGASAALSQRFQAADCRGLAFRPKFQVSTSAKHSRKNGASLHVVVQSGAGQANIGSVHVACPRSCPRGSTHSNWRVLEASSTPTRRPARRARKSAGRRRAHRSCRLR